MTGIGNDHQIASLSNCFVIGIDGDADSYGAIMRLDEEQVQLMKRRGGVGHDLSRSVPRALLSTTPPLPRRDWFRSWNASAIPRGRWRRMEDGAH